MWHFLIWLLCYKKTENKVSNLASGEALKDIYIPKYSVSETLRILFSDFPDFLILKVSRDHKRSETLGRFYLN